MKKVLALVLAVIMVCTMAFAVTVLPGTTTGKLPTITGSPAIGGTTTSETPVYKIVPGEVLYFTLDQLMDLSNQAIPAFDKDTDNDGNKDLDLSKVKVTVTYGKGAEFVASQGWVQVGNDVDDYHSFQYQIALKQDVTKVADEKVVEFSIDKITVKPYGSVATEIVFDGKGTNPTKITATVGYDSADLQLTTKAYTVNPVTAEDTVYTVKASADGKITKATYTENLVTLNGAALNNGYATITWTLNVGNKINKLDMTAALTAANAVKATGNKYGCEEAKIVAANVNDVKVAADVVVTNATEAFHAYAIAADGTVTALATKLDDGVMTFTAPAYSVIAVYNGTLSNVKAATPAGTGTTNPGTGANDVVGVAAALAVVALVSGAAISLKK